MFSAAAVQFEVPVSRPLALTIVVPTFNERDNIVPLLDGLARALPDVEWEAIFVDDGSIDGTPELVTSIAADNRCVRLLRRFGRRGLASAVVEGMLASTAPVLAVIDADRQHDETVLPALYRKVADGADLAVGTRYGAGGSLGRWSKGRARASRFATALSGLLLKTELSDPMSGFFVIRREAFMASLPRLSGMGYKILLDLVASAPVPLTIREIPYTFRPRVAGESKLDPAIMLEYALLLFDKLVGQWLPIRFAMFLCVGGLGVGVHLALLGLLLGIGATAFATAQMVAVIGSMTFNFLLNNQFTYRDRRLSGAALVRGLASFYLVCGAGAVANIGIGSVIYGGHHTWWAAGMAGAAIGSVWNYAVSSALTWRR